MKAAVPAVGWYPLNRLVGGQYVELQQTRTELRVPRTSMLSDCYWVYPLHTGIPFVLHSRDSQSSKFLQSHPTKQLPFF